jgi:RNA polymerase sigma-B factor
MTLISLPSQAATASPRAGDSAGGTVTSLHGRRSTRLTRARRSELTRELLLEAAEAEPGRRAELLDEVVLLNRGVAEAVANRYRNRGVPLEDLQQAAFEGLVKAVQRFDAAVRPDLLTYAVPTIRGEIQRWFRDQSWMVRPPRRIQELQWKISHGAEDLGQSLGREPTDEEVAAHCDCTVEEVAEASQAFGCFHPPSLDRPIDSADGPTLGETLLADEEHEHEAAEARTILGPVVRRLSERDRRILYLRFFEDQSQRDIGEELGVTQMQVSRLLDRIFRDLRSELA